MLNIPSSRFCHQQCMRMRGSNILLTINPAITAWIVIECAIMTNGFNWFYTDYLITRVTIPRTQTCTGVTRVHDIIFLDILYSSILKFVLLLGVVSLSCSLLYSCTISWNVLLPRCITIIDHDVIYVRNNLFTIIESINTSLLW